MTMVNTLVMVYIIDIIFYYSILYYTSVFLIDINECTEDTHSCDGNASCTNTIGSYNCTCNFGFEGDGLNCTGEYCYHNISCANSILLFIYLQYLMFVNSHHFLFAFFYSLLAAFNVCEHPSLVDCHFNADCVDIVGGYECHCTTGYTGNGTHCSG